MMTLDQFSKSQSEGILATLAQESSLNLESVLQTLREVSPYVEAHWGVRVLGVFGSIARGEASPDSDIDILFDYDQPIGWALVNVGDYLESQFGRKVDLLSKRAVRAKVWPLIQNDLRYV